jgi:hypothetical protein
VIGEVTFKVGGKVLTATLNSNHSTTCANGVYSRILWLMARQHDKALMSMGDYGIDALHEFARFTNGKLTLAERPPSPPGVIY